jgi:hypothetical protein
MNVLPLKKALQRVVGGAVITFFVVLLTLVFSFLGTIICAALAGMMLGAARLSRWQVGAASLLFPSVIFGVLRTSGADLPLEKVLMLSGMCLATFWLTYLIVSIMISYERKTGGSAGKAASGVASSMRHNAHLSLDVLQGKWRLEPGLTARADRRKILEIHKETLSLRLPGPAGERRYQARLKLMTGNTLPVLALSSEQEHRAADTHFSI